MKTKKFLLTAAVLAGAGMLVGADPKGFEIWSGSDLRDYGKKLGPKMSEKKVATEQLARYDKHNVMMAYREGDGEAEVHDNMVDVFVVQSGEATVVVGGKVVGERTIGPGEIRADSIEGGTKHPLKAGDVVNIPAKVPHQVLVSSGKKVTYLIVKVAQ